MIESDINQQAVLYNVSKAFNAIAQNIDEAIEAIDFGDTEAGLDMLKAISREVGSEK